MSYCLPTTILVWAVLLVPSAYAQHRLPVPPPSSAACAAFADTLASAGPASDGWQGLSACGGTGGSAIGSAVLTAAGTNDSLALLNLWQVSRDIRDAAIFNAAISTAQNSSASAEARVIAWLIALAQHEPGYDRRPTVAWGTLVMSPPPSDCGLRPDGAPVEFVSAGALPANYLTTLASATEAAYKGTTAPQPVKTIARCVRELISDMAPVRVPNSALKLTYMCGNRFRVRNTGTEWIDVSWDVYNTADRGDLSVGPGADEFFTTEVKGTTRLFYFGALVQTKANGGTVCSP